MLHEHAVKIWSKPNKTQGQPDYILTVWSSILIVLIAEDQRGKINTGQCDRLGITGNYWGSGAVKAGRKPLPNVSHAE